MNEEIVENIESKKDVEQPGSSASAEGKTYTQDDLNKMFGERAKQAKAALLKELGFDDLDSATALISKARETEESNKSELQKAQERAEALEKQLADAALAQKTMATQNEVASTAMKLGIVDPDAAYKLLDKGAIEYGEDGKPTNVETLLQGLLKDKPYLAGTDSPGPFNRGKGDYIDPMIAAAKAAAGLT